MYACHDVITRATNRRNLSGTGEASDCKRTTAEFDTDKRFLTSASSLRSMYETLLVPGAYARDDRWMLVHRSHHCYIPRKCHPNFFAFLFCGKF